MCNPGPEIKESNHNALLKLWIAVLSFVCILSCVSVVMLFRQCNELSSQVASLESNIIELSSQPSERSSTSDSIPKDILGIHTSDYKELSSEIDGLARVCKSIYHKKENHTGALTECEKCSEIFDKGYTWDIE